MRIAGLIFRHDNAVTSPAAKAVTLFIFFIIIPPKTCGTGNITAAFLYIYYYTILLTESKALCTKDELFVQIVRNLKRTSYVQLFLLPEFGT